MHNEDLASIIIAINENVSEMKASSAAMELRIVERMGAIESQLALQGQKLESLDNARSFWYDNAWSVISPLLTALITGFAVLHFKQPANAQLFRDYPELIATAPKESFRGSLFPSPKH